MREKIDCRRFEEHLDAWLAGRLPAEEAAALEIHAASCPDCAALQRLEKHLAAPTGAAFEAELAAEAPEVWIEGLGARLAAREPVARAVPDRARGRWLGLLPGRPVRWLVPAMAAAVVLLLVATGALLVEVAALRDREQGLARLLARQEERLQVLAGGVYALEPLAVSTSSSAAGAPARRWARALGSRESVTVGDLRELLARLPADAVLLDAAATRSLTRQIAPWQASTWQRPLAEVRTEDGLQPAEVLRVLESLDLKPSTRIPTQRLRGWSRRFAGEGSL